MQWRGTASVARLGRIRMAWEDAAVFLPAFKIPAPGVYRKEWEEILDENGADRQEEGGVMEQEPLRGKTGRTRYVVSAKDALVRWRSHTEYPPWCR